MSETIESMVVKIGFDLTALKKGQVVVQQLLEKTRQSTESQGKKIEESGKHSAEAFNKIRDAALEFLAVFTAGKGFMDFMRFITNTDASMTRLSRAFGVSAQDLGSWGGAAETVGGTMQGMEQTITDLVTRVQSIGITGDTGIIGYLRSLNVELKFSKNGAVDTTALLLDLNKAMNSGAWANASNQQKATFLEKMGITDLGTINLILMATDALTKLLAVQTKYRAQQVDTDAAVARQEAFTKLDLAWQQVGRNIITWLTPAILGITKALNAVADFALAHPNVMHAVFAGAAALVIGLSAALTVFTVGGLLGAVGAAFATLGITITVALGPLGILLGLLTAAVAAITYINEKMPLTKSGSAWDQLGESGRNAAIQKYGSYEKAKNAVNAEGGAGSGTGGGTGAGTGPLGVRSNNPGNLMPGGREAVYGSPAAGLDAEANLLRSYARRGIDNIAAIVARWAPAAGGNDVAAYVSDLSRRTGFAPGQRLDLNDPATLASMMSAITIHEQGFQPYGAGAYAAAVGRAGIGAAASNGVPGAGAGGGNTTTITTGPINITTNTNDPNAHGKIIQDRIKRLAPVNSAVSG